MRTALTIAGAVAATIVVIAALNRVGKPASVWSRIVG